MEEALTNTIILKHIFRYFSTGFLLKSCSLVNTTWNRDARIYIRNHRKCTAKNPHGNSKSTCQLVRDVLVLCHRIKRQGREVPFNSLKVDLLGDIQGCPQNSGCDGVVHTGLPTKFRLKYLELTGESSKDDYQLQDSSVCLIRAHASQLQWLGIESFLLMEQILSNDDHPVYFTRVEELQSDSVDWRLHEQQKNILRGMVEKSPNLKSITAYDSEFLKILPKEHFGLASCLLFDVDEVLDDATHKILFQEFVESKPTEGVDFARKHRKESRAHASDQVPFYTVADILCRKPEGAYNF